MNAMKARTFRLGLLLFVTAALSATVGGQLRTPLTPVLTMSTGLVP